MTCMCMCTCVCVRLLYCIISIWLLLVFTVFDVCTTYLDASINTARLVGAPMRLCTRSFQRVAYRLAQRSRTTYSASRPNRSRSVPHWRSKTIPTFAFRCRRCTPTDRCPRCSGVCNMDCATSVNCACISNRWRSVWIFACIWDYHSDSDEIYAAKFCCCLSLVFFFFLFFQNFITFLVGILYES